MLKDLGLAAEASITCGSAVRAFVKQLMNSPTLKRRPIGFTANLGEEE